MESASSGTLRPEKQMLDQIEDIRSNLWEHIRLAESDDGLLSLVDCHHPDLIPRASRLREEHEDLWRQMDLLQTKLIFSSQSGGGDLKEVYRQAGELLSDLRKHQEHSDRLVFDAYLYEGGAGD